MENILEKSFVNKQLGIKLNSYIDEQCNVCLVSSRTSCSNTWLQKYS